MRRRRILVQRQTRLLDHRPQYETRIDPRHARQLGEHLAVQALEVGAETGKPDPAFGIGGRVDVIAGLPYAERMRNYAINSTPVVVLGHIPLWTIWEPWGWGTGDADRAIA